MDHISYQKLGNAVGTTGVLFYLGCVLLMTIGGEKFSIFFFNSILHGLDTTNVIRMHIPVWESAVGIVLTFILGWLFGTGIALIYNLQSKN